MIIISHTHNTIIKMTRIVTVAMVIYVSHSESLDSSSSDLLSAGSKVKQYTLDGRLD